MYHLHTILACSFNPTTRRNGIIHSLRRLSKKLRPSNFKASWKLIPISGFELLIVSRNIPCFYLLFLCLNRSYPVLGERSYPVCFFFII